MGTPIYNGPSTIYRVRVEQRPGEDFKRYYPEEAKKIDRTGHIIADDQLAWRNIMMPVELAWYKTLAEAQSKIDHQVEFNKNYTVETIPYTPK